MNDSTHRQQADLLGSRRIPALIRELVNALTGNEKAALVVQTALAAGAPIADPTHVSGIAQLDQLHTLLVEQRPAEPARTAVAGAVQT